MSTRSGQARANRREAWRLSGTDGGRRMQPAPMGPIRGSASGGCRCGGEDLGEFVGSAPHRPVAGREVDEV